MSKIEWTDASWNPIVGCSIVSPGCTHCYAMKMARRIEAMGSAPHYRGTTKVVNGKGVWTGKVALAPEHIIREPLRRQRPTMYFVNSMGDLFHEDVPLVWIDRIFEIMGACPQHTFQVLTKRSHLMRDYMSSVRAHDAWNSCRLDREAWPPRNVWLGVSAERQTEADERVPHLLDTPATVRFVSAEPLLGPVDFTSLVVSDGIRRDAMQGWRAVRYAPGHYEHAPHSPDTHLDWVIVGGESGTGARPMHPDWARSIRGQCEAADVAFFFKQWGGHAPASIVFPHDHLPGDADIMVPATKAKAGRLLDGREWSEMPRVGAAHEVAA